MRLKTLNLFGLTLFIALGVILAAIMQNPARAAEPEFERGKKLFKKCIHCHTYKKEQPHRIGPNLYGMFGRKAGAIADFEFSPAWKNATFLWTDQTLNTYLKAPHEMIPNNRMPFDGLSRAEDRHALIVYMRKIIAP